jgi:hypothetical protein
MRNLLSGEVTMATVDETTSAHLAIPITPCQPTDSGEAAPSVPLVDEAPADWALEDWPMAQW